MNYFYKLPTKFEDTNPIHYINLTNIQSISMITEVVPDTTGGTIKRACLIVNGIKYVYDSVRFSGITVVGDNKAQTIEYEKNKYRIRSRVQVYYDTIKHDNSWYYGKGSKMY